MLAAWLEPVAASEDVEYLNEGVLDRVDRSVYGTVAFDAADIERPGVHCALAEKASRRTAIEAARRH